MRAGGVNSPAFSMLKATKDFQSRLLGYVKKDDPIAEGPHGEHLVSIGLAERYQTKVVRRKPVAEKTEPKKTTKRGKSSGKRKRTNSTDD